MVPAICDKGTHYITHMRLTHMRLTLGILKRLNDFDFILEVMGDYIGTDVALHHLACFVTPRGFDILTDSLAHSLDTLRQAFVTKVNIAFQSKCIYLFLTT